MALYLQRRRPAMLAATGLLSVAITLLPGAATAGGTLPPGQSPHPLGLLGPPNPFVASGGFGAPHNDSQSSDSSPQPGPGGGSLNSTYVPGSSCATILLNRSGYPIVQCVDQVIPQPDNTYAYQYSLRILDPGTLGVLASLPLPPTGQYGVYFYLDRHDRIVVGSGSGHVLRVAHKRGADGLWRFDIVNDWDISQHVTGHCGGKPSCDYVVSVKPDWGGRIWFSTTKGVVGTLNPINGAAQSRKLATGEQVTKAISSSSRGVAVVSTHALYLFRARAGGLPKVEWREAYERGGGTKPGQLIDGTGTSPSFFGPGDDRYLTIIDNATPREHMLVYRIKGARGPRLMCKVPLFAPGASATDDTSMAIERSVIAVNTYGYSYFDYTPVPLPGGMTRVDVRRDESGCDVVWTNPTATITMAKLSASKGLVYTFERTVANSIPTYSFVVVDARTGGTVRKLPVGNSFIHEGLQLNGTLAPDGSFYQGTLGGLIRVRPAAAPAG